MGIPWFCHMRMSVLCIQGLLLSWTMCSHYGLSRQATEAMVVVEAYKVSRDRAPYPPDQVVRDLQGKFAFVLFDARAHTLFIARMSLKTTQSCTQWIVMVAFHFNGEWLEMGPWSVLMIKMSLQRLVEIAVLFFLQDVST
ncbi:Stem-specific protein TSJT1 [Camellia lanceoleosa]|uniref:Stem-specific protein TSJT1 n=1 Tax=Camellia lanceoleosa TaxID=1840588 RepID=A0ACC0GK19_9ERIC|nr:Stem-specific protein TSJT1 [Camellia lanceoleosa]